MESKSPLGINIPLGSYDFLGYLYPGLTIILCTTVNDYLIHRYSFASKLQNYHGPVYTMFNEFSKVPREQWGVILLFLLAILGSAYIIGHVVASISSVLIDRLLVAKGYGYPYEKLLDIKNPEDVITNVNPDFIEKVSRNYYKGLVFWLNIIVLLLYGYIYMRINKPSIAYYYFIAAALIAITVAVMTVYKVFSSGSNKARMKPSPKTVKFFWLFASPYNLISKLISHFSSTQTVFPKNFIECYERNVRELTGEDYRELHTNNYWLSFLYVKKNSPTYSHLIDNWLKLYGFSRNLAVSFYLSFAYVLTSLYLQSDVFIDMKSIYHRQILFLGIPVLLYSFFLMMLFRYYYLYVHYYSKFIFRAFVYLREIEREENLRGSHQRRFPPDPEPMGKNQFHAKADPDEYQDL